MPNFTFEEELLDKGYLNIAGADETSRGVLIGPVFAGAVILSQDLVPLFSTILDDSKKLSEKKRREYSDLIKASCKWAIGEASTQEVDDLNILEATKLAMFRAWSQLKDVDYLLIDGNMTFAIDMPYKSIVKGDSKSLSIAAASIIAKDYQCAYMYELDKLYPLYQLANCKGYGTVQHCKAIEKYGPCPEHRQTFKRVREFV